MGRNIDLAGRVVEPVDVGGDVGDRGGCRCLDVEVCDLATPEGLP